MKFSRRAESDEVGFQLAPMIDVAFFLVLFFAVTSIFYRLEPELKVVIPTAEKGLVPPRMGAGEIIINVRQDGIIVVNQRDMTSDELTELLTRFSSQYKGQPVIIRGDRKAYHETVVDVLDACAKADIWNVSFATDKKPTKERRN